MVVSPEATVDEKKRQCSGSPKKREKNENKTILKG